MRGGLNHTRRAAARKAGLYGAGGFGLNAAAPRETMPDDFLGDTSPSLRAKVQAGVRFPTCSAADGGRIFRREGRWRAGVGCGKSQHSTGNPNSEVRGAHAAGVPFSAARRKLRTTHFFVRGGEL